MKEMQEFEQVERIYADLSLNVTEEVVLASDYDALLSYTKELAAARASEGGWIDCKQELPPQGVRIEIIDMREPFPEFTADHMGVGHSDLSWWSKIAQHFTHWRIIVLPSPPLSVETPEVSK
jgi:hypothetical protein